MFHDDKHVKNSKSGTRYDAFRGDSVDRPVRDRLALAPKRLVSDLGVSITWSLAKWASEGLSAIIAAITPSGRMAAGAMSMAAASASSAESYRPTCAFSQ